MCIDSHALSINHTHTEYKYIVTLCISYIAKPVSPPYKHEKNKKPCIVLTPSVGMLENSDPAIAPIIRF